MHFRGFDGNDESEFRGYALYLQRAKRWENVLGRGDLNSHAPTRDRYDHMLEEWKASVDKDELTKEDIERIIFSETYGWHSNQAKTHSD